MTFLCYLGGIMTYRAGDAVLLSVSTRQWQVTFVRTLVPYRVFGQRNPTALFPLSKIDPLRVDPEIHGLQDKTRTKTGGMGDGAPRWPCKFSILITRNFVA